MQSIALHKQPGASYSSHALKVYDVRWGGEVVGTVQSDFGVGWNVRDTAMNQVSRHGTIEAAGQSNMVRGVQVT